MNAGEIYFSFVLFSMTTGLPKEAEVSCAPGGHCDLRAEVLYMVKTQLVADFERYWEVQ